MLSTSDGCRYAANTAASAAAAPAQARVRRSAGRFTAGSGTQAATGWGRATGCSRTGWFSSAAATPSATAIHHTTS